MLTILQGLQVELLRVDENSWGTRETYSTLERLTVHICYDHGVC